MAKMIPAIALAVLVFLLPASGFAGQRGAPAPAPSAPSSRPAPANQPSNPSTPSTNQPANTNPANPSPLPPIFLTGSVKMSDGTPAPPAVAVRIVCGTSAIRTDTVTDPGGNFSIVLNGQTNGPDIEGFNNGNGISIQRLFGCEVRAYLGGYISSVINLERQSTLDDPEIGIIYLHPLSEGDSEGYTVSLTTKLAPKDARKEYDKGLASEKARKWPEAEQEFLKAVTIYPRFAVAWYELGKVCREEKKVDDALHAQLQAVEFEPKFVNPYAELTELSFQKQKWQDVVDFTSKMIKLQAYSAPQVYFYNAAANFNLHQLDEAEKSARTAARLDDKHKVPRINYILGFILAEKKDYKGAAENLRLYLQYNPSASDAPAVQQQAAELEKAGAGQ
ncbi:MAG TPA: tetratricopeptide repeat protein [Terriglobia bacterium]|jgi:tetratricopeptide (TPR) repeat protein